MNKRSSAASFGGPSDGSRPASAERLRQLSDEVSRIASTLSRLSTEHSTAGTAIDLPQDDVPPVSAKTVALVIRARQLRMTYFEEGLFADPAWDMMLDLLHAELSQVRISVSSLCAAAAVPPTTALRWLHSLVEQGLFVRRPDPHDGRRVFVELAPEQSIALRRYFAAIAQMAEN